MSAPAHRPRRPEALQVHDLTVSFRGHPAVHHLSGRFAPGALTAVVGPNGAGKSTLLATLAGAIRSYEGRIERGPGTRIAYLPQASTLERSFPLNVHDAVAMGLWERIGSFGAVSRADRARIGHALAAVGLGGFEGRWIGELSSGQLQRTLFARLLLQDADLILLDEPFNAIDARTTADLLSLLQRWRGEARTVVAVLHDLEQVRAHFEEVLLLAGLSLPAMSAGGFVAALAVALAAGFVTRSTPQREDASFAAFYLIALALGVLLVSLRGSQVDLMHLLFGSVLAVDDAALVLIAGVASVTTLGLALMWRPLVMESVDPGFLRSVGGPGFAAHMLLLVLLVANLVGAFQALGTLMAVGLMMLPAAAARFWAASLPGMVALAVGLGMASGAAGLLWSYHAELPSGPCIVLVCGAAYLASVVLGRRDGLLTRRLQARTHLTG